jgi:hypothetical protein
MVEEKSAKKANGKKSIATSISTTMTPYTDRRAANDQVTKTKSGNATT